MRFDDKYSGNVFIGAGEDVEAAQAILYGMPMDWTVTFRPGSRFGPARIRESSLVLEEYSPYMERDLTEICYYDAGDLPLAFGNPKKSLVQIGEFVRRIIQKGKFALGMGGEHLVSLPVIQEMYAQYPNLAVIQMDAHADLRTDYEGEAYSHATVMRKVVQMIGGENVYQLGIRSMTGDEVLFAKESGVHFHPFEVLEPLHQIVKQLKGRPVYVTIDIDVLDPSCAPGTGTPEPGGITSRELFSAVHEIARSSARVVGADLVEVAPIYDSSEQTPVAAAKCIREMLLGFL